MPGRRPHGKRSGSRRRTSGVPQADRDRASRQNRASVPPSPQPDSMGSAPSTPLRDPEEGTVQSNSPQIPEQVPPQISDQVPSQISDQIPPRSPDQIPPQSQDQIPPQNQDLTLPQNQDQNPLQSPDQVPPQSPDQNPSQNLDQIPPQSLDQIPPQSLDPNPLQSLNPILPQSLDLNSLQSPDPIIPQSLDPIPPQSLDQIPPDGSSLAPILQDGNPDETRGEEVAQPGGDSQDVDMGAPPAPVAREDAGVESIMSPEQPGFHTSSSLPPLTQGSPANVAVTNIDATGNLTAQAGGGDGPNSGRADPPVTEAPSVTHTRDAISPTGDLDSQHGGGARVRERRRDFAPQPSPAWASSPKLTPAEGAEVNTWFSNFTQSFRSAISNKHTPSADDNMNTPKRRVAKLEEELAAEIHATKKLERDNQRQQQDIRSLRIRNKELFDELERLMPERRALTEENHNLRHHIDHLVAVNGQLQGEKEHLLRNCADLARQQKEQVRQNGALSNQVEELQKAVAKLDERLKSAHSKIFSLQPTRDVLTVKEAETEYTTLMSNIEAWVDMMIGPFLRDMDKLAAVQFRAANSRQCVKRLRDSIESRRDLFHATRFPETEVDVFVTLVVRMLRSSIFESAPVGMAPSSYDSLTFTEQSMSEYVRPRRDQRTISNWKAETFNAILSHPDFQHQQTEAAMSVRREIEEVFEIFLKDNPNRGAISTQLFNTVIRPALQLDAKFRTSTDQYYLTQASYLDWDVATTEKPIPATEPDLFDNLRKLECLDINRNRKVFSLGAVAGPKLTREEVGSRLHVVLATHPALYVRRIDSGGGGGEGGFGEPEIVSRQQVLIVWGSEEERQKLCHRGRTGLLRQLFGLRPWV